MSGGRALRLSVLLCGVGLIVGAAPSGFFHVAKDGEGRWWSVDPNGRTGIVCGVNHVWPRDYPHGRAPGEWTTNTVERLRQWGFNLTDGETDVWNYNRANPERAMPCAVQAWLAGGYSGNALKEPDKWICAPDAGCGRNFPNVFNPGFQDYCERKARDQWSKLKDCPWIYGWFLDNELAWHGRGEADTGLYEAVERLPATHHARQALDRYLADGAKDPEARETKLGFLRIIAREYFRITVGALKKYDPNHLVLGCRFIGLNISRVVWEEAARYCDVVTFNLYSPVDLDTNEVQLRPGVRGPVTERLSEIASWIDKPLMVTEWSFVSLESDRPNLWCDMRYYKTQAERARAAGLYLRAILSEPKMIGTNFYKLADCNPKEREDANFGLVDIRDEAYAEFVSALARMNAAAVGWHRLKPVPVSEVADRERRHPPNARAAYGAFERQKGTLRSGDEVRAVFCAPDGTGPLASLVSAGRPLCHCQVMVHHLVKGESHAFHPLGRVRSAVGGRDADGRETLTCVLESRPSDPARYEAELRLTRIDDGRAIGLELLRIRNTGSEAMMLADVLFLPYPDFPAVSGEPILHRRHVWGEPDHCSWVEANGGARRIDLCTWSPRAGRMAFYQDKVGVYHPDGKFPIGPKALPSGTTFEADAGLYYVVISASLSEQGALGGRETVNMTE